MFINKKLKVYGIVLVVVLGKVQPKIFKEGLQLYKIKLIKLQLYNK